MNYIKSKLFIASIIFFSVTQISIAQPNYSVHSIELYNQGVVLQRENKFELAEQKYLQAIQIQPNLKEAKSNLASLYLNQANDYFHSGNYKTSISMYKKSLTHNPSSINAQQGLAQTYLMDEQFKSAIAMYNKILQAAPDDRIALQNLRYANSKLEDESLNKSLNTLGTKVLTPAPNNVYRLVKCKNGIPSAYVNQIKPILDLIWSEPSGRIILAKLASARIPINITQGVLDANATTTNKKNTFYLYGIIPVFSYNTSRLEVNIPFNYVSNLNNPSLSNYQRVYSLHVFLHEFCHAYRAIKNPTSFNSIEEELGASMIGYNISYKVLTGNYMNQDLAQRYSLACFESLMKDTHRDLPLYSGFNREMSSYGLVLPCPKVYSNLRLMYNTLLSEGKIYPVSNFEKY